MNTPAWNQFLDQLPITFFVMGRTCTIRPYSDGGWNSSVGDLVDAEMVDNVTHAFEARKWMVTTIGLGTPLSLSECREEVTSKEAISEFLKFFLNQPIGPRLLTFDQSRGLRSYGLRETAINQAYLNWFAVNYAARRANGKLKNAIPCAGYGRDTRPSVRLSFSDFKFSGKHSTPSTYSMLGMCRSNVLDLSGCCPSHQKSTAKTLFNFYPHFEEEGRLENSCVTKRKEVVAVNNKKDHRLPKATLDQILDELVQRGVGTILLSFDLDHVALVDPEGSGELPVRMKYSDGLTLAQVRNILRGSIVPLGGML